MNDELPDLDHELERAVMEVLSTRGPLGLEELRVELAKEHRIVSDDELQPMRWHSDVFDFADETYGHVPTLAEGLVLTHELSELELELGMLDPGVDLGLWDRLADEGVTLAAGGVMRAEYAIRGTEMPGDSGVALAGPDGWLDGWVAGDVIALRYLGGQAVLEPADYPDDYEAHADELAALSAATHRAVEEDIQFGDPTYPGASAAEIVMRLRQLEPHALRRSLPPLSGLVEALGFESYRGYVGPPGTPWEGSPELLDEHQTLAWRAWRASLALARDEESPGDEELVVLARRLTGLVFDYAAQDMGEPEAQWLAETMLRAVEAPLSAVPLLLLACAAEDRGDGPAWLSLIERVVAADPQAAEALATLADLRSVSGDAREAKRLYALAGVDPRADEFRMLRTFLEPPAGGPGRNKPCPCGSGKKYKVCHGRTTTHPLPNRAAWLFHKVVLFLQRPPQREELLEWGALLSGTDPDDEAALDHVQNDQTTWDFAAFEGGLLAEFVSVLGPLLPDDERVLAESWSVAPRRLMEVLEVVPMRGLKVRDLILSEELEIRDRTMTRTVQVGDLLFGVPLDDGDGVLRFQLNGLSLPRLMRAPLLAMLRADASGEEVAAFLAPKSPQLKTSTGEELVMCTARYAGADLEAVWEALAEELGQPGEDQLRLLGPDDVILGTVDREGERLVVRTHAIERLRVLQEMMTRAGSLRLIDESTRPWESLSDEVARSTTEPVELDAADVEGIRRQLEDRWLADRIPALGGLTPPEAAASDEARADLVALLDDFEWTQRRSPQQLGYDVGRLRRELGL